MDTATFDAVQASLAQNATQHRERPLKVAEALLQGKIFDAAGRPMSPTFSEGSAGRPYRYYVSSDLQRGRSGQGEDALHRVSAAPVEYLLRIAMGRLLDRPDIVWPEAAEMMRRVTVRRSSVSVLFDTPVGDGSMALARKRIAERLVSGEELIVEDGALLVHMPMTVRVRGGRTWLLTQGGSRDVVRGRPNPKLVKALKDAHRIVRETRLAPEAGLNVLVLAVGPADAYQRKLSRLAFLAPDIQAAILEGRQPASVTLDQLFDEALPLAWDDQRRALGFGA